jgi:tetratricopeptide (TPR) repeat protein
MALGFGFNKAKVLSTAEKFVQQGKLQNAIAEYDKIAKQDPKDLTVLNTIGDLYSRVGNNRQAIECFKRVGEAYATAGFTLKAIAMYKKVSKLGPNDFEVILRMADLYSQQGLLSDARSQYMLLADQYIKTGQNDSAAEIFRKMLVLDPENAGMQSRLADLYVKLGKKEEAKTIFLTAAQALHVRSSPGAAEEALDRLLKIDPTNSQALVLRAQIAAEAGKNEKAVACLEKLPDLDSRPDALNALLRALLQSGRLEEAEPIATKLLNVHNDSSGVKPYAEALLNAGRFEAALHLYDRYADRLLSADPKVLLDSLHSCIGRFKENATALELVLSLLRKAGEATYINEVLELLAHAYVQTGRLQKAADLYKELTELEPENPLHQQSLTQISARMGTDPASRELSAEESRQALMAEELQDTAPGITPNYPKNIADAVRAALTDSELFASYNLPEKAIAPLESALQAAPQDPQLHQQLTALYVRCGRLQDAANSCKILSRLYAEAGHKAQANQYAEMAAKYEDKAGEQPALAPQISSLSTPGVKSKPRTIVEPAAAAANDFTASSVANLSFEEPPPVVIAEQEEIEEEEEEEEVEEMEVSAASPGFGGAAVLVSDVSSAGASDPETTHEIDLSGEWEDMLIAEEAPAEPVEFQADAPVQPQAVIPVPAAPPAIDVKPVVQAAPPVPQTTQPPALSPAPQSKVDPADDKEQEFKQTVEEIKFYIEQEMMAEAQTAMARLVAMAPERRIVKQLQAEVLAALAKHAPKAQEPPVVAPAKPPQPAPVGEFSFELDVSDHASTPVLPTVPPPAPKIPHQAPAPATLNRPRPAAGNPLGDFVLDLEEALGSDFGQSPSAPRMAAAAVSGVPIAAATPSFSTTSAPAEAVTAPAAKAQSRNTRDEDAISTLSDLFEEFKGEVGENDDSSEDPETHYNLGVAFKEMGLLDEAIGELQKVCHAINKGQQFSQTIQAYTWLAHCLMEKGVPQAAVRWYQNALQMPGIGEEGRLAVYYDLASAHEAAGNRQAALENLMEVYGSNIDYRDVAERIKALRS